MKYQSQNDGLLSLKHVTHGMRLKIVEDAYVTASATNGKEYWNAKVELPDGSHKLANVGGITGDLFVEAWGMETQDWVGKYVHVDIRTSRNTGNEYIVLVPAVDDAQTVKDGKLAEKEKPVIDLAQVADEQEEDGRINSDEIPF